MTEKPEDVVPEKIDEILRALHGKLTDDDQWFSKDEVANLRLIAEYREEIVKEMKYRRAKKVLFGEWMSIVIAFGSAVSFMVVLREDLWELLKWVFGK